MLCFQFTTIGSRREHRRQFCPNFKNIYICGSNSREYNSRHIFVTAFRHKFCDLLYHHRYPSIILFISRVRNLSVKRTWSLMVVLFGTSSQEDYGNGSTTTTHMSGDCTLQFFDVFNYMNATCTNCRPEQFQFQFLGPLIGTRCFFF